MKRVLRDNGLGLFFGVIFLVTLAGQSLTGLAVYNQEQLSHGLSQIGWLRFVTSSAFTVDVAENWQSEYLQFFLFIAATIWLVQRGSPESKKIGKEGISSDEEQLVGEPGLGEGERVQTLVVFEFAALGDGHHLLLVVVRAIGGRCRGI